jgi:hypothetical protein
MRRRKSISHYWGSAHRERSPEEKAQAEKETLEHVASILREECGRKDKTIGALELMVKSLAEELRLSRAERDEATRRLDEVTLGTGGAASGVEELKTCGEIWRGKFEALQLRYADLLRENCRLRKELGIRDGRESHFGAGASPSTARDFKANSTEENCRRKGGASKGHAGHGRRQATGGKAEEVTETCGVRASEAGCCESPELVHIGSRRREYDRYIPERWEHVVVREETCRCLHCGKLVRARPGDVLPRMSYSNSALVHVAGEVYLRGRTAKSIARAIGIRPGTLFGLMDTLAGLLRPAFDEIMTDALRQTFLHADETRWWIDGRKGYAWVFTNRNIYLVLLKDTRAASIPASLFGYKDPRPGQEGVSLAETRGLVFLTLLITDRYGGYLPVRVAHQFCFEHLKRDLDKLLGISEGLEEVETFCSRFRPLLAESMSLCANRQLEDAAYLEQANELKEKIRRMVFAEAEDPELRGYQDIWRDNWDSLFHWVENRDVRCENNTAERAIRPLVIARKASFGSQGGRGVEDRQVITTVLKTVELRGMDPGKWLEDVLGRKARDASFKIEEALPATNPRYEFKTAAEDTG